MRRGLLRLGSLVASSVDTNLPLFSVCATMGKRIGKLCTCLYILFGSHLSLCEMDAVSNPSLSFSHPIPRCAEKETEPEKAKLVRVAKRHREVQICTLVLQSPCSFLFFKFIDLF